MLGYVMQTEEVNKALSLFSRLFDVRIAFFDANDAELFFFDVKQRSEYCQWIRNRGEFCPLCEESDCTHLAQAKESREICIYHCHRGLFEAIVPLFDAAGAYLGALVFGQLRDSSKPVAPQPSKKVEKMYRALPEITPQRVREVADLLKYVSEAITEKAWLKRCRESWAEMLEEYITEHIHEPLKIGMLARAVNCSVSFITHNFQQTFGAAPSKYIQTKKLELARQRLLEGYRVFEVAQEFGFYDQYHFSRAFRQQFGYPPSEAGNNAGKYKYP